MSYTYAEQLSPGERYVFSVRASSGAGLSDASASAFVDVPRGPVLAPNPPGNLVAELTSDRDVLLTWSAPAASPDRAPVTSYKVFLETLNGEFDELEETLSLSYRHPIPEAPTRRRYIFYVRALSDVGPSQPSRSASVDVPPEGTQVDIQAPAPPGDFTAVRTPNNDALLQWTAPTPSPDRAPFTHFEVYRELPGDQMSEKLGESRSLSYLHPDLERGETYVFYVVAVSGVLRGHPSRSAIIDVPQEPTGILPPSAPGGFTAELTPNNDVQFDWTEPERAANRASVQGYLVYEVRSGGGACILNLDSGGNIVCESDRVPELVEELTYLHSPKTPLAPGQRYTYFVRARSIEVPDPDDSSMKVNLMSTPSATASVDVLADPLVPLSIPHVTVRADQSGGMTDRVIVSWVHNLVPQLQSVVTGFELQYCNVLPNHPFDHCPDGNWQTPQLFGSTVRTHSDSFTCAFDADLQTARMYRVRAIANNPSLSSRYSVPTRPICPGATYSPPRRVDALYAVGIDDVFVGSRINICWEQPVDNNSDLLGYELQATTGPNLPATEDGWVIVDAHIDPDVDMDDDVDPCCRYAGMLPVLRSG